MTCDGYCRGRTNADHDVAIRLAKRGQLSFLPEYPVLLRTTEFSEWVGM
jgi:hypothetical protein